MTLFKAAWFSRLIFKISRGFSLLCILIDCVTGALNRTDRTFSIWPVHHNHARLNFLDRSAINCKAGRNSCLPLRRLCPHIPTHVENVHGTPPFYGKPSPIVISLFYTNYQPSIFQHLKSMFACDVVTSSRSS